MATSKGQPEYLVHHGQDRQVHHHADHTDGGELQKADELLGTARNTPAG